MTGVVAKADGTKVAEDKRREKGSRIAVTTTRRMEGIKGLGRKKRMETDDGTGTGVSGKWRLAGREA